MAAILGIIIIAALQAGAGKRGYARFTDGLGVEQQRRTRSSNEKRRTEAYEKGRGMRGVELGRSFRHAAIPRPS
jgi:hypothetical protein